ncbi:MAG TPA: caspase domain-containing protein [Hyphomicrobiaceae bacterium]|nr:caspase domain-containing protein [Hyphomicrobiaceae bacterium]
MRRFGAIAFLWAFLALGATAHAQNRIALVIGNSAYLHTPELKNPKNDAADMAAALRMHGFQVLEGLDLDKPGFDRKVRDFAAALKGVDAGVFFYAGHGLQVAGHNYLVPIDAQARDAATLDLEMVRVDVVHRIMEQQTSTNILFLDACRDNPLARNLARSLGTRSSEVGRGLARVESGVGTLISFSTQPGNVALDGRGRNSPFAGALVRRLGAPKDLSAILIDVRNDVMRETQDKQVPWEHSALRGQFYFGAAPLAVPTALQQTDAAREWTGLDKTSLAEVETFLRRHPSSPEADYARARVEALKKPQAAAAAPISGPVAKPPGEPKAGSGRFDRTLRLSGGKTVDLLDGKLSFTMIGTPFGARGDLVGVMANGTRGPLAVGQLVFIEAQPDPCALYLLELHPKQNEADFALTCGSSVAGLPRKHVTLSVKLSDAAAPTETFTMSGGKTRQLQPGGMLLTFIGTPYAASGVHAGIRVQGETKALAVGERVEVPAGAHKCALTLREIHKGSNSAEFGWQC